MAKKTFILFFCALLLTSTLVVWNTPCSANPIAISLTEDGSALHKGEFVHMPSADVEINITRSYDSVTVHLFGMYEIETNQTQNTSLAYVYPSLNPDSSTIENMTIFVDSVETEFTVLSWNELIALNFSEDLRDYTQMYANFAYFNISLLANTTMNLQVHASYAFTLGSEIGWEYHYIFGSARSFEGDTWEKIHIHLVEETPFLGTSFNPTDYLELTQNGIVTDAIWEFNVSSIESNNVRFYGSYRSTSNPGPIEFVIVTSLILCVAVFSVYHLRKKTT